MKRLIAMLLALVLTLSMLPVTAITAFADELPTLVDTVTEETIPEETAPEETVPEETVPEETVPEETVPKETIPEETIPEETVPEETIPEETLPEETLPEETVPEETVPEETIPEETIPEETVPEETVPEETIPKKNDAEVTVTASGWCGSNVTWTLTSDGTLTISGTGPMTNYSYHSDVPWYSKRSNIKTVVMEDGVTSIGKYAFYYCTSLESVTIPDSVTSIGYCGFCRCVSLKSVTIPDSVTTIGYAAFEACSSLTGIIIPDTVTAISDDAFRSCSGLTSVTIGNSVTTIGDYAFYYCNNLTNITIGNSVTTIGDYAFEKCSSLTSVTIPDSVITIGDDAFYNCSSLKSITIGSSVTSIGKFAFSWCSSLTDVYITDMAAWLNISFADSDSNPLGANDHEKNLYLNSEPVTDVVIPEGVTTISDCAFYTCSSLTSIAIPDSVTTIGSSAFSGCSSLTSITIPNGVKSIGGSAFSDCTSLTDVTLPDDLTYMGNAIFKGCRALTAMDIPDGVKNIGARAFDGCVNLHSIEIPNGVTSIGESAFRGCRGLTSITIPDSVNKIEKTALAGCVNLQSVTIPFVGQQRDPDWYYYPFGYIFGHLSSDGGVPVSQRYYIDSNWGYTYATYYIPASLKTVTVTGGNIIDGAFHNCTMLTSITIPDSATEIGEYAFEGCTGLTAIWASENSTAFSSDEYGVLYNKDMTTLIKCPGGYSGVLQIPDSVTAINADALYDCKNLTAFQVCENNPNYCSDENGVLYNKDMTTLIQCPVSFSGSLTIPDSVTKIAENAFRGCTGLTGVTFSENLTSIDGYAFYGCEGLKELVLPDSMSTVGDYAFSDCTGLETVTIGDGTTVIGNYAFYKCTGLQSVTFGDSVATIGEYAFYNCSSLTSITIPASVTNIKSSAFYGCESINEIHFMGDAPSPGSIVFYRVTATAYYPAGNTTWTSDVMKNYSGTITWKARVNKGNCGDNLSWTMSEDGTLAVFGTGAMYDYTGGDQPWHELRDSITSVVIAKGTTSVGNKAFGGYENITSVSFPDTLLTIGDGAFNGCALQKVTIPASVTRIGAYAFGSVAADSIIFAGSAPSMDENAFYGVEAYVSYPANNDTWSNVAGSHFGGTLIWCPDGKTPVRPVPGTKEVIASGTFDDNGKWAVYNDGLLKITADGDGDASMNFETAPWHDYRTKIWEVYVGEGITAIEEGDLANLPQVTTVTIGASVNSLGSEAFTGATRNLRTVWFEGDAPEISSDAFRGVTASVHFKTIYPAWEEVAYADYRGSLNWIAHTAFSECGEDLTWILEGDTLTITGLGDMYDFTGGDHPWNNFYDEIATVIVENGVTGIGDYAFAGLPEGVKIIFQGAGPSFGDNAFSGVTAIAYYPVEKNNWTQDVMGQYGGTVTWVGYDKNTTPTFEKNENVTYLSQTAAAEAINAHLLARDTEFSIYAYQTFNASTTNAQLMKVGETLLSSAFGKTDGANDWEYLDSHFAGYSYELTYGHDGQKYYLNIHYKVGYLTTAEQEAKVDSKVKSILKDLGLSKASDYKKIEGIYNYLIKNVNYDDTLTEEADLLKYTAYGALVNKKANSYGFAVAFYRLATELGLYAHHIRGTLTGSLEYDAWNIVYLNGYYYCLDAAQDAIRYDAGKSKSYFLKGTDYFENHEPDQVYVDGYGEYCSPINYRSDAVWIGRCGDSVYWVMCDDNTLRIVGQGEMKKPYNSMSKCEDYTDKIVIEDGVTSIGDSAFEDFRYVKSVKIPKSVTRIDNYAFAYCYSLKSVTIPNGVTTIGNSVFLSCNKLTKVDVAGSVVSIGVRAFEDCTALKTVTLRKGLQVIGDYAFNDCKALTGITIPSTVTTIKEYAFASCKALTSMTIPASVTTLEEGVFFECTKLRTVKLNCSSITAIPSNLFRTCEKLTSVNIPSNVTSIGPYAFLECRSLPSITLPQGLQFIGDEAFCGCYKLKNIVIPESVTTIEAEAFLACGLEKITFRGDYPASGNGGSGAMGKDVLKFVEATAYYPGDNETWTEDVRKNYGGTITWKEIPCTLGQVKNLKVSSVSGTSVKIKYSSVKNASKYEIYVDGLLYGTTSNTSYTIDDLTCNVTYDVHVVATKTSSGVLHCGPASDTIQIRPYYDLSDYSVTMEYTSAIYDGESKLPAVTVRKSSASEALIQDVDYTISYENYTDIGTATITITGINAYGGTIKKTFKILPDQVKNLNVEIASGTSVNITFDPVPGATEYWIYRNGERKVKITDTSYTMTGLSAGKTYKFYVKANKPVDGENYTGAASETVSVKPVYTMDGYTVSLKYAERAYTGSSRTNTVTVKTASGKKLTKDTDYTVSYENNKNVGTATVTIKGKGKYSGTLTTTFDIVPAQVSKPKAEVEQLQYGSAINITFKSVKQADWFEIYLNGELHNSTGELGYFTEYLEPGSYSIKVRAVSYIDGKEYYGELSDAVKVTVRKTVKYCTPQLSQYEYVYTGKSHKPAVTVYGYEGEVLTEGVDYTVSYKNNKNTGKAYVEIKGKGNYNGTIKEYFTINPAQVTGLKVSSTTKSSVKISFKKASSNSTKYYRVYVNDEYVGRTTSSSYTIKNLELGQIYSVYVIPEKTVSGTTYYGEACAPIEVWPGTGISGYKATLDFTTATYTGEAMFPGVVLKTSSKSSAKVLVEGVDYTVTYENNVGPGKAKVILKGIGVYTGTITKTFKINPPQVTNVTATAVSKSKIEVSFDAAPGATSYWVYVNGDRKAKITDTTCTISGLSKNKTYKITVKAVAAVDGTNYTSAATAAVSCKTPSK